MSRLNASSLILEGSRSGTKTIINHSAVAHAPNIRYVAVYFRHASDIETISAVRIAVIVVRNPKFSPRAGNSGVEQR